MGVILDRVVHVDLGCLNLDKEIILVDDGSGDGSDDEVRSYMRSRPNVPITMIRSERNRGKGHAIREGLKVATGRFVIIQDADLEYFPEDWVELLRPLVENRTKVVYGTRKARPTGRYPGRAIFDLALAIENLFIRLLYGVAISDVATCYKAFRTDLLRSLNLKRNGFSFCVEVTCKLLSAGVGIVERPIRYLPRGRRDGKKIRARDLFSALYEILRCRLVYGRPRAATPFSQEEGDVLEIGKP